MDDEFNFLEKAKNFASVHKVYLGVTYAAVDPVGQNKFVFITKEGEIAIDYNKANPVPGVVSVCIHRWRTYSLTTLLRKHNPLALPSFSTWTQKSLVEWAVASVLTLISHNSLHNQARSTLI